MREARICWNVRNILLTCYLILTQDLRYAVTADLASLLEEVSKLLGAYASAIDAKR